MLDPRPYLEKDFAYHADMLDALLAEGTKVLYSEEDGVLLKMNGWGPYCLSAKTAEAMTKMAKLMEQKRYMAVIRPLCFMPEFVAVKGRPEEMMPCYQAAYKGKEPVSEPEVPGMDIKPLPMEQLRFVMENYDDDEEYMRSRIEYGMLGAFDENGNCAGFVGFHGEGSMGLLTVLPEYRRKGIGFALESRNLNRRLSEGRIPFGHVVVGNEKSMGLQKKIGMEFSDKIVTWVFSD